MDKQQILEHIRTLKRDIMPNEKLILFGSQARGDEREDSDWDLLVLLNKPTLSADDDDNYGYPFAEMGWKYGVYLSTKVYTVSEWEKRSPSPFYKNVQHDGIEIV
ncbi:MAG: nucleotidyltransferase domain-containing protein [Tannerella sp.]|jgi:predicted nucleotidyltransferase|nr:nucleotidyltransferase domain-containing protein [Tannerella sp.]